MTASATSHLPGRDHLLARAASALRHEYVLFLLATSAVGLHIVDDNFLQPQAGTSAGDHLASGLIPIAVLAAIAALYPRLRAGARATTAMTLGAIAITVGIPGVYYLLDGSASGDHYTGLLAIVAGATLLVVGPVTLWKARRRDGSRRRSPEAANAPCPSSTSRPARRAAANARAERGSACATRGSRTRVVFLEQARSRVTGCQRRGTTEWWLRGNRRLIACEAWRSRVIHATKCL